jgi:acetoin:2,6-dichlorophenolindophenol oxidoreductase subunit beta
MAERTLKYREALDEALVQAMEANPSVFCLGVGVDDPKGIFGTTLTAFRKFGPARVLDTPLAENAMTGIAVGAALCGMRPVMVHARNDFLLLAMDQLVNHAAKWRYMSGGGLRVPLTVRAIIGRGWGQAAQHSQSLQAMVAHVPGLRVAMPSTPREAKGLLLAAIADESPTVLLEHRALFENSGPVPAEPYVTAVGSAAVIRSGADVTIVALSQMVLEAAKAAEILAADGISAEIVDPRWVAPLDDEMILSSVRRTGRLVVADTGWTSFGVSAEVAARVAERLFGVLKGPVQRVALPDVPTPCSAALEGLYYPGAAEIVAAVRRAVGATGAEPRELVGRGPRGMATKDTFQGPF